MILQGDHLEAYKEFFGRFLPSIEYQAYGARGKAANFYWIEV